MGRYFRRRLLTAIPVFFGITFLVFVLLSLSPADVTDLGEGASGGAQQAALEEAAVYAGEQIGQEVLEREDAAKEELTAEGVTFVDVDNAAFTEHFSGYAEANFPDLADWCNQIRALAPNA